MAVCTGLEEDEHQGTERDQDLSRPAPAHERRRAPRCAARASRRSASRSTIAERAKPGASGGRCITPWTKRGRKVVSPMITMPARTATTHRPRRLAGGSRGSSEIIGSGERRSWTTRRRRRRRRRWAVMHRPIPMLGLVVEKRGSGPRHHRGDGEVNTLALTWSIRPRASDLFLVQEEPGSQPRRGRRIGRFIRNRRPGPGPKLDDEAADQPTDDGRDRPDVGEPARILPRSWTE